MKQNRIFTTNRRKSATIIPKEKVVADRRVCVIGGNAPEDAAPEDEVPTIVIEKDTRGRIAKIIVRCTCGQSAELYLSEDP